MFHRFFRLVGSNISITVGWD